MKEEQRSRLDAYDERSRAFWARTSDESKPYWAQMKANGEKTLCQLGDAAERGERAQAEVRYDV